MSSSKAAFSNSELFVLKKKQKQRNQDPPKLLREVFNIHFSAEGWAGNFNQITIFVSFIPVSTSPLYHFITPEFVNSFSSSKPIFYFMGINKVEAGPLSNIKQPATCSLFLELEQKFIFQIST